VGSILEQMGIELSGTTRTPDEIIDRVLVKARRQSAMHGGKRREALERVLGVLAGLNALRGSADIVLADARALLAAHAVPLDALDELSRILERLADYDLPGVRIELAPGMARGIAYYTGMIFELYAPDAESPPAPDALQICGGGRYDSLARALTGRSGFPALGFAFGVERLLHALSPTAPVLQVRSRVLIVVHEPEARRSAQRLADALRAEGTAVVVRDADRDADRVCDHARRAGYDAATVVRAYAPDRPATGVCATLFREDDASAGTI
jgi:histidyl-tRNA synthetase